MAGTFTASGHKTDYVFITLAALLVVLGLVFLSSASSAKGFREFNDSYYFLKHQVLYGLLPGLVLFFILARVEYQRLRVLALPSLIFCFVALLAVFIPGLGLSLGGARRWIDIGISVQTSELVKLGFLIYLAAWLETKGDDIRDWRKGFMPFVLTLGAVLALILLQPDVGTMSVVAVSAFFVYMLAGAPVTHLISLVGAGVGALWLAIKLAPYRAARLTVFLNPELDPQGIGYHINQALLAVGSGGIFGVGLGYSRQKYQYLPEVKGDSIFAVMAEEMGFIFTVLFLCLIATFLWRGLRIAARAPDAFGRYLGVGIVAWLGWQTCINMASMLNILPLTGVPFPLVSYGGTALVTSLAALGILVSISKQARGASTS